MVLELLDLALVRLAEAINDGLVVGPLGRRRAEILADSPAGALLSTARSSDVSSARAQAAEEKRSTHPVVSERSELVHDSIQAIRRATVREDLVLDTQPDGDPGLSPGRRELRVKSARHPRGVS
mgnify:CR=1 FL=1